MHIQKITLVCRAQSLYNECQFRIIVDMQNLINELTNGTKEYDSDGNMLVKSPTAVMLKAARVLKQIADINIANNDIMNQLQLRVNEQLNEITQLREINDSLIAASNTSICEDQGQVSGVGGSDSGPPVSDSDGQGSGEVSSEPDSSSPSN